MKYIVYKTTCLINNKIYIGVHRTINPYKFDGYLGRGFYKNHTKYIKNPQSPLHYAIIKYGVNNFKRETLFIYDSYEEAFNKEKEIVTKEFINRNDTYNVSLGGDTPVKIAKKVFQFDLNGILINSFKSSLEASKHLNVNISNINDAILNKRTCLNSLWSHNDKIDIQQFKITKHNIYYIYDNEGNFIKEATSDECIKFLNTDTGNLTRAVKLNNKIRGYFISLEKFDHITIQITKLLGKLNRYSLDGKYIDSFDSVKLAKEKLGLKLCSISLAIKLGRQCNGYRWTRSDNPELVIKIK